MDRGCICPHTGQMMVRRPKALEGTPARLEWRYEPGCHAVFIGRGAALGCSRAISAPNS
jgi:hypothetical protein